MTQDNGYTLGDQDQTHGQIVHINSTALGKTLPVLVFTPSDYDSTDTHYPVGYVLHGRNDQAIGEAGLRTLYHRDTGLAEFANQFKCILVCPIIGCTWYIDSPDKPEDAYATYVGADVPAGIDQQLRTLPSRDKRFLMGFSMGGHGAVTLLARYPDTFCAAASRGGVMDLTTEIKDLYWDECMAAETLGSYWDNPKRFHLHSALNQINQIRERTDVGIVLDVGTEDFLLPSNRRLRTHLQNIKMPHIYTETPDGHCIHRQIFLRLLTTLQDFIPTI